MTETDALKNLIEKVKYYDHIVILRHTNPDGDALGSSFGLKEILKENLSKEKKIYVVGSEERKGNFFKMFPKYDEFDFSQKEKFLVVILDTANRERINEQSYIKADYIIKIDHHTFVDKYADFEIINEKASSTSEMVFELTESVGIKVPKAAYKYLLIGMVTDTDRFRYPSTNENTLKYASSIYEIIDFSKIYEKIYYKSLKDYQIGSKIFNKTQFTSNGVAVFIMPKWFSIKHNYKNGAKKIFVNDLIAPDEIKFSLFASYNFEEKVWKGSLRSKEVAINDLAQKFNGGGHKLASGFLLDSKKEVKKLAKELIELAEISHVKKT